MSYAFHGNFCGPGWSGGTYQSSAVTDVSPVDELDSTCKTHDEVYSRGGNLLEADLQFAKTNLHSLQTKRAIYGLGVGMQGLARAVGALPTRARDIRTTKQPNLRMSTKTKPLPPTKGKPALRGPLQPTPGRRIKSPKPTTQLPSLQTCMAPVSIGTSIRSIKPTTTTSGQSTTVRGREFLGPVTVQNPLLFELAGVYPLHPAYYTASTMGQYARIYQHFRFRKATIHFVTQQPTTIVGDVALCYAKNATEPAENGGSAAFYPRVMTRGNALIGPVWSNHSMRVECDDQWRLMDALTSDAFANNVNGEIQIYSNAPTTATLGYLLIDYELEVKNTMLTPHTGFMPVPTGPGCLTSFVFPAYVAGGPITTNIVTTPATQYTPTNCPAGTMLRCLLITTGTTASTQTTVTTIHGTSTTPVSAGSLLALTDGAEFYVVSDGTAWWFYASYNYAFSGSGSGQLFWGISQGSGLVYNCISYAVRYGYTTSNNAN